MGIVCWFDPLVLPSPCQASLAEEQMVVKVPLSWRALHEKEDRGWLSNYQMVMRMSFVEITHFLQFDAGHFYLDIFCLCFACFPRWLDVNAPLWHCGCHRARHPGPWQFHFRLRGCTTPLCPRSRSKWDRWRSVKWSRGICNQCVGLWGKGIESRGYGFWWDVASKCLQNNLHHFGTKLF